MPLSTTRCWERGAKALIPIGSLYCEWRKEVGDPTQCLHISLAVACWRCAYPPFPLRKHCLSLRQGLESLLSIDHWHRSTTLCAAWTGRVKDTSPCKAGVETSRGEVRLRKASFAVILSLGQINNLSC